MTNGVPSSRRGLLLNPIDALLNSVFERRQIWIINSVGILVREKLEGAKADFWNVEDVLTIYSLRSIKGGAKVLIILASCCWEKDFGELLPCFIPITDSRVAIQFPRIRTADFDPAAAALLASRLRLRAILRFFSKLALVRGGGRLRRL